MKKGVFASLLVLSLTCAAPVTAATLGHILISVDSFGVDSFGTVTRGESVTSVHDPFVPTEYVVISNPVASRTDILSHPEAIAPGFRYRWGKFWTVQASLYDGRVRLGLGFLF